MRSRWAGRFIGLTFALGGVAWLIFTLLVLGNVLAGIGNFPLGPASSRIVAGGGAGSWFTMGILSFLLVGIGGIGFTAFFYQAIEGTMGVPLTGWRNLGAGIHLVLGGLGSAGASLLMAWGGFPAGGGPPPPPPGGGGAQSGGLPPRHPSPNPGPGAPAPWGSPLPVPPLRGGFSPPPPA